MVKGKKAISLLVFFILISLCSPLAISAQGQPFPTYTNNTLNPTTGPGPATFKDLEVVFARIIGISTTIAVIAFFIMFVIAAFKFLTSGGEAKATESARNTMTYAVIGILVIVGAYIVLAVLEATTGVKVTIFSIPSSNPAPT